MSSRSCPARWRCSAVVDRMTMLSKQVMASVLATVKASRLPLRDQRSRMYPTSSCCTPSRPSFESTLASITGELVLGSVTKHVLAESQGDVLIICGWRQP